MMSQRDEAVMVIDTEQSWLEFCSVTLEKNGYQVYTALTRWEAEKLLSTQPEINVVLVLIDIKTLEEDESTISVLGQSETGLKRSVVAVFSTDLTPDRTRRAFKMGASDCVSKPYDETTLLALLEQMLADHRIAAVRQKSATRASSNVLVIDDDNDWLVSLEKYLPPVDSVLRATDYHTAVQQLSLQSFDLVVVDLRLVDADDSNFQGMDLIRLIREQDRQRGKFTQIVVVSAFGTPEHIRESYRTFNIYYYFDKRYFSPSKYRDSIAEALR
jgi:DNA-binding NtrC family response regulator